MGKSTISMAIFNSYVNVGKPTSWEIWDDMSICRICEPVLHRDCTQTVDPQTLGQLGGQGSWTFPAVDGNSAAFHEGWGVLSSVVLTDLSQIYYVCDWRPRRICHRLDVNNQRNTLTGGVIHCEDFLFWCALKIHDIHGFLAAGWKRQTSEMERSCHIFTWVIWMMQSPGISEETGIFGSWDVHRDMATGMLLLTLKSDLGAIVPRYSWVISKFTLPRRRFEALKWCEWKGFAPVGAFKPERFENRSYPGILL